MSDDSNSTLAENQIDRQLRRSSDSDSGGSIRSRDPRVDRAATWLMNLLQGLMVIVLAFVANNLYQVNLTLAGDAVLKQQMLSAIAALNSRLDKNEARDDRQEDHLNDVDRRTVKVEQATGTQTRGGPRRGN